MHAVLVPAQLDGWEEKITRVTKETETRAGFEV